METPDRKEPSLWVALERLGHAVGSSAGDLLSSLVEEAPGEGNGRISWTWSGGL